MIFDSDLVIAICILLIGAVFFTATMGEYLGVHRDATITEILHDKATTQLKSLICDGTIEACILLINNNKSSIAENILKNRIIYNNYKLIIGNYMISEGNCNGSFAIVSAVVAMNRTEGWYGVYWNSTFVGITDKHYLTYEEAVDETLKEINETYGDTKLFNVTAIYYFNISRPVDVKFILYQ
jgi:hypothetical protein